uniref:Uncharacterized protein n=1 Tax=Kalanchoe fedtschenkoi TaxID=63787 RepID=A0A7N0VN89_KALFE
MAPCSIGMKIHKINYDLCTSVLPMTMSRFKDDVMVAVDFFSRACLMMGHCAFTCKASTSYCILPHVSSKKHTRQFVF